MSTDPTHHLFWLSSRAFGVVALVLVSLSVGVGLALAGRVSRRTGLPAQLKRAHESLALAGLIAIVIHGLLLLGDSYLRPGLVGITVPFALTTQPIWTGLGIIGGWLTAVIVGSFYVRRWIGVKVWRWLHRWTFAVYGLGIVHTLGSGTDARSAWLLALIALTAAPIALLGALRLWPPAPRPARGRALAGAAAGHARPRS
jgi:methionine sulfoxide reductase heme-binding subunit